MRSEREPAGMAPATADEIHHEIDDGHEGYFDAHGVGFDKEKCVGGVAEGEEEDDDEEEPVAGGEIGEMKTGEEFFAFFTGFADAEDEDEDGQDGRDAGEEEEEPEVAGEGGEEGKGGKRTGYGPAVVHGFLKAEALACFAIFDRSGDEAVAGGGADAFAEAFEETEEEDLERRDDEGVERDDEGREAVTDEHEGFVAAYPVAAES